MLEVEIFNKWFNIKYDKLLIGDCMNYDKIKVVIINEVVPQNKENDFYAENSNSEYKNSVITIFNKAGINVESTKQLLEYGIYLTNAVKSPKEEYAISTATIEEHSHNLENELNQFSNIKVVMLMGDVAKKSYNYIVKRQSNKKVIPSGSTYKIRKEKYYYNNIRVMPSYIITGGNILIEKSKVEMIIEDIKDMAKMIELNWVIKC